MASYVCFCPGVCIVAIKKCFQRLCASDPHLLFRRLEAQVTECVIEAKVRQLTQLTSGPKSKTPAFCLDFVDRLITDFKQLSQAAEQMSDVIKTLVSRFIRTQCCHMWRWYPKKGANVEKQNGLFGIHPAVIGKLSFFPSSTKY